jgi:hypothetical protein
MKIHMEDYEHPSGEITIFQEPEKFSQLWG